MSNDNGFEEWLDSYELCSHLFEDIREPYVDLKEKHKKELAQKDKEIEQLLLDARKFNKQRNEVKEKLDLLTKCSVMINEQDCIKGNDIIKCQGCKNKELLKECE